MVTPCLVLSIVDVIPWETMAVKTHVVTAIHNLKQTLGWWLN